MITQDTLFGIAMGGNLPFRGCSPTSTATLAQDGPAATLSCALAALPRAGFAIRAVSRFYRTPCFLPGAGPDFVNAAVLADAPHGPQEALDHLHAIEAEMGRERGERWSARTLDLDLLFAGDAVLPDPDTQDAWRALPPEEQARQSPGRLILPHPRMQDRGFVLVPLAEICPGWTHPRTGQTVRQMLEALPDPEREAIHAL